jgi:hypothetical protein
MKAMSIWTSGIVISVVTVIVGSIWSLPVVVHELGFIGFLAAVTLFPIAIALTPLYVGFTTGNWILAAITYGGQILSGVAYVLARVIDKRQSGRYDHVPPTP